MKKYLTSSLFVTITLALCTLLFSYQILNSRESMEDKKPAEVPSVPEGHEIATFGAGCYWCVEAVYQRLDGVKAVTSGFMGGDVANPTYEAVVSGSTGHAEVVQVVFDPKKISFDDLVTWFWKLHDPTTLNRQGADVGTQYRSAIFFHSEEQQKTAKANMVTAQKNFPQPIVTEITKASTFYPAKVSHQDYYRINGQKNPYCRAVITPKLKKLNLEDK